MKKKTSIFVLALLVFAMFYGAIGIRTVKTGEVGIVSTFGKVSDTRHAGMTWVAFPFQKVTKIKVTQDKMESEYNVSTSDMQSNIH